MNEKLCKRARKFFKTVQGENWEGFYKRWKKLYRRDALV